MDTELINHAFNEAKPYACWSCGAHISARDNYCSRCGKGQGSFVDWYYKHLGILILIFGAGPFALYFVWRSPVLSRNAKWIYTAVVAMFTWYVGRVFYNVWTFFHNILGAMPLQ